MGDQQFAGRGEPQRPAVLLDDGQPGFPFQDGQLLGDRGRGQVQRLGRRATVP